MRVNIKIFGLSWLMLLALPFLAAGADKGDVTVYLQLIRGTDDDKPPVAEAQPAGQGVSRRLKMFKWKNYWEIKRQAVTLKDGGKNRQRMSPKREIEVSLSGPQELTIRVFDEGKLTVHRKQPLETAFYITGGDIDESQSWFIVVRRDKPPGELVSLH